MTYLFHKKCKNKGSKNNWWEGFSCNHFYSHLLHTPVATFLKTNIIFLECICFSWFPVLTFRNFWGKYLSAFDFDLFASEFRRPRLIKQPKTSSTYTYSGSASTKVESSTSRKQTLAGSTGGWWMRAAINSCTPNGFKLKKLFRDMHWKKHKIIYNLLYRYIEPFIFFNTKSFFFK